MNFMIGHFFGQKIIASGKVKALTPEHLEKTQKFLDKHGHLAIFLGRFFPFIRTFVPFIAGMGGMHWRNFGIYNILGGLTWSKRFELLIVGIVAVSIIPTVVGLIRGRMSKGEKNNEEATDTNEDEA